MLQEERVRLMTRLSIFEESAEGKSALKINKFYKNDYVRWELIKTVVSVTVGFLLILVLVGLYFSEYLIAHAISLDYVGIGMKILGCYLVLVVIYISAALIGYNYRYREERKNLVRYYKSLKRLLAVYQGEDSDEQEDTIE